jgi:hypothetical protein
VAQCSQTSSAPFEQTGPRVLANNDKTRGNRNASVGDLAQRQQRVAGLHQSMRLFLCDVQGSKKFGKGCET